MVRSLEVVLLVVLPLAIATGCESQTAEDRDLIGQVLLAEVSKRSDAPDSVLIHMFMTDSGVSRDSALVLSEVEWVGAWYELVDNHVTIPPAVRARFAKHFDPSQPPRDPYSSLRRVYVVTDRVVSTDSAMTAMIKLPYTGCKYGFHRRSGAWKLSPGEPTDCWMQ